MTWKSATALASAMILTAGLVVCALVFSSPPEVHGSTNGEVPRTSRSTHEVVTPLGRVVGSLQVSKAADSFIAYKSIPYAKPPVGDLRFKRPQELDDVSTPAGEDEEIINSESYKKSCWSATKRSPSLYYGEDCLYLNVYTPATHNVSTGSLPVMIWIHGGGYIAGSTFPEPSKLVSHGDVITVTVNYRMSVFGFLTTLDDALPSNNGLWDQYMAIRWVHKHISHFGGNASSITVFGESAGANSVGLHVLSPLTAPHFHKAVLQSGAPTSLITRNPRETASKFAQLVGCSAHTQSSPALAACLRNVSVNDLLQHSLPEWYVSSTAQRQVDFIWTPVVDGGIVFDNPMDLIHNASYLSTVGAFDKDYIIGVLNDEGALITTNFLYQMQLSDVANASFFSDLVTTLFNNRYGPGASLTPTISQAISTFYTGEPDAKITPSPTSVLDFAADAIFLAPATELALALTGESAASSKQTNVFFYHFDFCPARSDNEAPCFRHGDEVALEFPKGSITDPTLAHLSDSFISLLTQFARDSNPGSAVGCGWPRFEPDNRKYLRISPYSDVRSYLYNSRMLFWLKTIPRLINNGLS